MRRRTVLVMALCLIAMYCNGGNREQLGADHTPADDDQNDDATDDDNDDAGGAVQIGPWKAYLAYNYPVFGDSYDCTVAEGMNAIEYQPLYRTCLLRGIWAQEHPLTVVAVGSTYQVASFPYSIVCDREGCSSDDIGLWHGLFWDVSGNGPNNVWAVGDGGLGEQRRSLFRFDGASWQETQISSTEWFLWALWVAPDGQVFAVGQQGLEWLVVQTNGTDWTETTGGPATSLQGVWGTSSSNVFSVGYWYDDEYRSRVLRHAGAGWEIIYNVDGYKFTDMHGCDENNVYVGAETGSGYYGDITVFHYDGETWTDIGPHGRNMSIHSVWAVSPTEVYVLTAAIVLRYNGETWEELGRTEEGVFEDFWLVPEKKTTEISN